jgi:hypothetical protein
MAGHNVADGYPRYDLSDLTGDRALMCNLGNRTSALEAICRWFEEGTTKSVLHPHRRASFPTSTPAGTGRVRVFAN